MRRVWVVAVLLMAAAAFAKPAPKAAPKPKRTPVRRMVVQPGATQGPGTVTFTTATTAYIDRGLSDGVAVGAGLTVTREGRLIGRCTIVTASDRWATCNAEAMRVGDRVAINRTPVPPPAALAPVPDEAQLKARRAQLDDEEPPKVDFAPGASGLLGGDRGRIASLAVSHTSWIDLSSPGGRFDVQRVDVGVYDVQIFRGLHGSADLTVLNFSQRPAGHRAPLGSPAVLVRQLELSFHDPKIPVIAQIGRTWTRHTPGLLALDGAQAAWRNADDSFEVGAYGGLHPEPVGLRPSTGRWSVGAFAMGRIESGRGPRSSLVQLEGRVGYGVGAGVPGRLEIAAAVHAWLTRAFDAHLQIELGFLGAASAAFIDAARLDFGWRPTDRVRLYASGRYQGTVASDLLELGVALPGGNRAIRSDAGLTIELTPAVWLAVTGGAASDFASGLTQASFGPELTFPQVARSTAVTLGYREELGWLRGRTAWAQVTFTPLSQLRILGRGSWFHEQLTAGNRGIAGSELGGALVIDWAIVRWLWVRATAFGRGQPGAAALESGTPAVGSVMVQVGGQL